MIGLKVQKLVNKHGYALIRREDLERLLEAYEQLKGLKKLERSLRAYHDQLKQMTENEKKPFRVEG